MDKSGETGESGEMGAAPRVPGTTDIEGFLEEPDRDGDGD